MKYFLLGAFASGFLLYGIALIYGATGSTNLDRIASAPWPAAGARPDAAGRPRAPAGGLRLQDLLGALPHVGARRLPGRAHAVTALIATGSKAAAFAALLRVLLTALRGAQPDWPLLMWGLAALTMTVGNVVAIAQQNLKRMLAYSSIAHAGYMLVGVVAGGSLGQRRACSSTCSPTRSRPRAPSARSCCSSARPRGGGARATTPGSPRGTRCWRWR